MQQPQDHRGTLTALPTYRPLPQQMSWVDVRIGDAERDATCDLLAAHFGAGRLSRDEFDFRTTNALAAQSRTQLAVLTADLPSMNQPRQLGMPQAKSSARLAAEVAMTLLSIAAAICLFLMMTMLAISNSPEGFVTSSLAILATSVITGTSVYWAMQRRR